MALFFSASTSSANPTKETYQDIINKAFALSLQKDRLQARTILLSSLAKEAKEPQSLTQLKKALSKVSRVFYSEKAQQTYESALSQVATDPSGSVTKLTEALRLEPDNLEIILSLGRLQIKRQNCDWTMKRLEELQEQVSFDEELLLLRGQTLLCLEKLSDFEEMRSKRGPESLRHKKYWTVLEAEHLFKTDKVQQALKVLADLGDKDDFPELFFWKWKVEQALKLDSEVSGRTYITQCKSLSSREFRDHLLEPQLCSRVSEVESSLKNKNNTD